MRDTGEIDRSSERYDFQQCRRALRTSDPCDERKHPKWRQLHDDECKLQHHFRSGIEHISQDFRIIADHDDADTDQDRKDNHRKDVPFGQRLDRVNRNHIDQALSQSGRG